MATTIVAHTYKLKRGKEDAILSANPLLLAGEPIVVFRNDGSTNLKIGDGVTYYRDLPWIGSENIYCARTFSSFPNVGKANVIYKAEETATLYQWNSVKLCYEPLGGSGVAGPITANDVIGLGEFVDARISEQLDNQVTDAVDTVVESLKTEFVTTETVTVIETEVKTLQETIETKADATEVEAIQSEVITVQNDVTVLQQTVANKADVSEVTELREVVNTKIDTEALEEAKLQMSAETDKKISNLTVEVDTKLAAKADDAEVDTLAATVEDLQAQVDSLGDGVVESVGTVTGGTAEDLLASLNP